MARRTVSTNKVPAVSTKKAQGAKPLCVASPRPAAALPDHVNANPGRAAAILSARGKWVNGTVLHFCFFATGPLAVPKKQADAIRQAFATWKALGIGLEFAEVQQLSEAEVRIGYSESDGDSASGVGRDILNVPLNQATTVYGWDLTTPYGRGTALHELGHVIGMEHEHQSPFAGITWHEQAVYDSLSKPPNGWDRPTIYRNILQKLSPQQVQGSAWDPDSIMEYEFGPGLIDVPEKYDVNGLIPPGVLSKADKEWVVKWYPPTKKKPKTIEPFQAETVELAAAQQVDFVFKPTESRKYTIETKGASDSVLVLFEDINATPRYLAGDDDSGQDRNASISYKLFQGRSYVIRLRLYYPGQTGMTSLMVT
jgi:hypothetical protein